MFLMPGLAAKCFVRPEATCRQRERQSLIEADLIRLYQIARDLRCANISRAVIGNIMRYRQMLFAAAGALSIR